jgi:ubiquinone/menaquinone biosynthesis C-methylase UbiE
MVEIESAWQRDKGKDFLRSERQFKHPVRRMFLEYAEGETVADFGCASCIDYPMWRDNNYKYTGIDFTQKFLDYAKQLYPSINLLRRDISDTGLKDKSFDTTYCKDGLEHQPRDKYKDILFEMWRLTTRVLMVAFFIAPTDKPTTYTVIKNLYYKNHYNKDEVIQTFINVTGNKPLIIENIGYNNTALYIVRRQKNE